MVGRRLKRGAAPLALLGALAVAQGAFLLLRPRGTTIEPASIDVHSVFSARQIERASDFAGPQRALALAGLALEGGAMALLVLRAPQRLRRPWRRPVLAAAAAGAAISLALTAIGLPLAAIARQRSVDVGLATGSWGVWAGDVARSAAISAALAALATAVVIALARRFPRRWWAAASVFLVLAGAGLTYATPLVIDPLFNHFKALPGGLLRSEVLDLARRAKVDIGGVYEIDASRRTSAANAYVTGVGGSRRVVLYDTLLRDFPPAEARIVVAHELGHVHARDVPRGLLYLLLVAPAGVFAVALLGRVWGPRTTDGDERPGPAQVPALTAAVLLVSLLLTISSNQLSRAVEARADTFALRLTGEAPAFIAQQRRIAIQNVSEPAPPAFWHALFGTHPTTLERIGAGQAYERGRR